MSESLTPRGSQLAFIGTALAANCAVALAALLLSWALGGDAYKDALYGNYAMPLLALGTGAGAAVRHACRYRRPAGA